MNSNKEIFPGAAEVELLNKAKKKILIYLNQWLRKGLESDTQSPFDNRVYVWPDAKSFAGSQRVLLQSKMKIFLQDKNKKVFLILGDPGAGKTTFGRQWLQAYTDIPLNSYLILPVRLSEIATLEGVHYGKNLLEGYLKEKIGLCVLEINELKAAALPMIVFLDGYDEIDYAGNFYVDNRWDANWPKTKFIVTTRPEKFGSMLRQHELQEILINRFAPIALSNKTTLIPLSLQLVELQPFSAIQKADFIQQWANKEREKNNNSWTYDYYEQKLNEIPVLQTLTENPVILTLVLYCLPKIMDKHAKRSLIEKQHFGRLDIYEQFVNVWFENQSARILNILQAKDKGLYQKALQPNKFALIEYLHRYSENLARTFLWEGEGGKLAVEVKVEETVREHLLQPRQGADSFVENLSSVEKQLFLETLRSGCLLKCDKNYFTFFHKSLIEYFAQTHIYKDVAALGLFEAWVKQINNKEDHAFSLNEKLLDEPNLLSLLSEHINRETKFKEQLYEVVKLSKTYMDVKIAAANAMTLLNIAKAPLVLSNESWSGIKIPGANLFGAFLHGADFKGADLSYVNFSNAYLAGTDFSEADLSYTDWGSVEEIKFDNHITACVYTWDGQWLLIGDSTGSIHFIDKQGWFVDHIVSCVPWYSFDKTRYEITGLVVDGCQQNRLSTILAAACKNGDIYLWSLPDGRYLRKLAFYEGDTNIKIAITASGKQIASDGEDKLIRLWDVATGKSQRVLRGVLPGFIGPCAPIICLSYAPNGQQLAWGGYDKTIRLWDVETGECLQELHGHTGWISCLSYAPNGQQLASGGYDKTIRLWDLATGECLQVLQGHTLKIKCLNYAPNGQQLASGSDDKTIRLWDATTGECRQELHGHTDEIWCLSYAPDGDQLASSGYRIIRIWDLTLGASLEVHTARISCLSYAPNGQQMASGSDDQSIRLWDVATGKSLQKLQGHTGDILCLSYAPNGQQLASGSKDKTIRLWDLATGKTHQILKEHAFSIMYLCYAPEGDQLASGDGDGIIYLWDVATGKSLQKLQKNAYGIMCLCYASNGQQLASGGRDNTINGDRKSVV